MSCGTSYEFLNTNFDELEEIFEDECERQGLIHLGLAYERKVLIYKECVSKLIQKKKFAETRKKQIEESLKAEKEYYHWKSRKKKVKKYVIIGIYVAVCLSLLTAAILSLTNTF